MNAIYFSRSPIPFSNKKNFIGFKQVCVIPSRRKFLDWYNKNIRPNENMSRYNYKFF